MKDCLIDIEGLGVVGVCVLKLRLVLLDGWDGDD